jgi:hypothetical protein
MVYKEYWRDLGKRGLVQWLNKELHKKIIIGEITKKKTQAKEVG